MNTMEIAASTRTGLEPSKDTSGCLESKDLLAADFDRLYALAFRFLMHRVFDRELAEELTAQTFCKVAATVQRVGNDAGQLQAWVLRIAANVAATHYRRHAVRRLFRLNAVKTGQGRASAVPGEDLSACERDARVRAALRSLAPREQTVLVLRYFLELPHREIAAVLGCREDAARARLSRAMNALRSKLNRVGEMPTS